MPGNVSVRGAFQLTPSARRATKSFIRDSFASQFQSTPSARRATSIMGSGQGAKKKFQSTPSARRATQKLRRDSAKRIFQSTPSARRATKEKAVFLQQRLISIHALREEGDLPRPS